MQIEFKYDLPHRFFCHWDKDGREFGVLVVKARFHINSGHVAGLTAEQPDFVATDEFYDDPASSPLKYESELAPYKPRTDIILNAVARSPEQKDCTNWRVGLQIDDLLTYQADVFGERHFHSTSSATGKKWTLSDTGKIQTLPLKYDYAYGGIVPVSDTETDYHPYNPAGTGLLNDHMLNNGLAVRAPQIGLLGELNNLEPGQEITVCGFGAIAKGWYPRLPLAGTFDKAWQEQRHPLMPEDYDMAFWNNAPVPLQASPYLQGGESVTVQGMFHDPKPYSFRLAGVGLQCTVRREDSLDPEHRILNLDTVYCDISSENPEDHEMVLTWRVILDKPDMISAIILSTRSLDNTGVAPAQNGRKPEPAQESQQAKMLRDMEKRKSVLEAIGISLADVQQMAASGGATVILKEQDMPYFYHLDQERNISLLTDSYSGKIIFIGLADYYYPSEADKNMEKTDDHVRELQLDQEVSIYIRLKDENIEVWRPIRALWHGKSIFYILPQQHLNFEDWEFRAHQKVICQARAVKEAIGFFAMEEFKFY